MPRMLSEFFSPKAISCKAFYKKCPKGPFKQKIKDVQMQEVKKGGDQQLAIFLEKSDCWITCNLTNAQKLAAKFGQDVDSWEGKMIMIAKQKTEFKGEFGFDLTPA